MEQSGDRPSTTATAKSSNEILSELFGAFNVEPPEIVDKEGSSGSDGEETDHSKKSRREKRKKSKKKHKSKVKKRKRKHSNSDSGRESESSVAKVKKKKKKSKERKTKKGTRSTSPNSVNIELPVNQVPLALEIMLDGTVGIKGEDGVITKIPDVASDAEKKSEELNMEADPVHNGKIVNTLTSGNSEVKSVDNEKGGEIKPVVDSKVPEVFEAEPVKDTQNDKQKKGKIQIRNLKFSSVFQETVKAFEEKQKREQERKAEIEEGELSDTSESEEHVDCDDGMTGDKDKDEKQDETDRRYWGHSKDYYKNEEIRIHLKKRKKSRSKLRSPSSRSRSRSAGSCSRSHSRRRSHTGYHSHDKHMHKRQRSRSRSRDRHHHHHSSHNSGERHAKRSRRSSSSPKMSHHSSRSRERRSRSRSRRSKERREKIDSPSRRSESKDPSKPKPKEKSEPVEKIDKEKLLAIARKNALKLIDAGVVPGGEKLTTIKAGGKTVNELTEYCKKLSKKEAEGKDTSDVDSDSSDGGEKPFHHPFQVRDRPNNIIMNIKNSIPLPVKSLQEKAAEQSKQLRLQFPVSSGSSHRRNESEWIPVSPPKKDPPVSDKQLAVPHTNMNAAGSYIPHQPVESNPLPTMAEMPIHFQPQYPQYAMQSLTEFTAVPPPEPVYNRPVFPVIQPGNPTSSKLDISSIVSRRLEAMRKLQENPNDLQALNEMYSAQQEMQYWAESKHEEGAFTGSTGAKILSASELSAGAPAWAKRDQLTSASPVKGGMGMALLQKMGWQPGEGLGKNKEGTLEPLKLEVKMDKKGLVASDESRSRGRKGGGPMMHRGPGGQTIKALDGKHPVSLLNEFCSRRRYSAPQFELCFECGPDHKKNFLFKVRVDGVEYTPSVASPNKKQAKAEAAALCLRALGVIPSNPT